MQLAIIIPWWLFLIHLIIAAAVMSILAVAFIFVTTGILWLTDELTGENKRRREGLKEFELRFFRHYLFNISKAYDDVLGIEYGSEDSAFTWFYHKYSYEELQSMESEKYELEELFTKEEIHKAFHPVTSIELNLTEHEENL